MFAKKFTRTQIHCLVNILEKHFGSSMLTYSTIAPTAASSLTMNAAKPFYDCPKVSTLEMVCGFLPGGKFYKKDTNEFLRIIHREKGNIVRLVGMLGKSDIIFTQNPDDFEVVFRSEGAWPERLVFEVIDYYRNVFRNEYFGKLTGLLVAQGKEWNYIRSLVNGILIHPRNVKVYLPAITSVNQDFIQRIRQIRDPKTMEVPANFKLEVNCWTLESVALVALDSRMGVIGGSNPDGSRLATNHHNLLELIVELELKPSLWRLMPNRKLNHAMSILNDMMDMITKYIDKALERIKQSSVVKPYDEQSVLEKLLKLDAKVATVMAMDMLVAGIDSTTTSFVGLLLCLAKNPDKQEKLRKEVLEVMPHKDSVLTVENMKKLPYLRACFKESLRIYPIAAGNTRTTCNDLVLSGYQIPKGTRLMLDHVNIMMDEQHYSEPEKFLPERWLRQPQSESQCPKKSSHAFAYIPFGFGPRSCIGRRIAAMEIEVAFINIVRNFRVEFNHSVENAFKGSRINLPAIPLKFKFVDIAV